MYTVGELFSEVLCFNVFNSSTKGERDLVFCLCCKQGFRGNSLKYKDLSWPVLNTP